MADSGPSLDGPAIFKNAIRSCPSSSSSTSPPGSTVTVTATAKLLSTLHLTGGEVSEENPPVKPVVAEILGQLCGYQKGGGFTPIPHCRSFSLQKQEYRELLKEVLKVAQQEQALHENGFPELWAWGPRHDYEPKTCTCTIHGLASTPQSRFIANLVAEIKRQLAIVAGFNGLISQFARKILVNDESSCIRLPASVWSSDKDKNGSFALDTPGCITHYPAAAFGHRVADYPGVLFEVSCDGKRVNLAALAEKSIMSSGGKVRVVVGFDIQYRGGSGNGNGKIEEVQGTTATFSVWRAKVTRQGDGEGEVLSVEQELVDVEFRDKYGNANYDSNIGLSLRLEDFTEPALHPLPMSDRIFIPTSALAFFLFDAERPEMELMLKKQQRRRKRTRVLEVEIEKDESEDCCTQDAWVGIGDEDVDKSIEGMLRMEYRPGKRKLLKLN